MNSHEIRDGYDVARAERTALLSLIASALPVYRSRTFWEAVVQPEVPLEVLVKILRTTLRDDAQGRERMLSIILRRLQTANERWAYSVVSRFSSSCKEKEALADDLCADLAEWVVRALLDPTRRFWEENFLHSLTFERKHVFRSFMAREGRWQDPMVRRGERVPRALLMSLDEPLLYENGDCSMLDVEDERLQAMLHAVENYEVLEAVLRLPDRLKAVVLLIFWEGRSEKDTARVLQVTDRTVRNRMRTALKLLGTVLLQEREACYG